MCYLVNEALHPEKLFKDYENHQTERDLKPEDEKRQWTPCSVVEMFMKNI